MTKTGRTENQDEMFGIEQSEQSEGEEEDDIEFADGSLTILIEKFEVPHLE